MATIIPPRVHTHTEADTHIHRSEHPLSPTQDHFKNTPLVSVCLWAWVYLLLYVCLCEDRFLSFRPGEWGHFGRSTLGDRPSKCCMRVKTWFKVQFMEWVGVMHLIVMVKPATSDCLATWGQQKRVVSTTLIYHHLLRLYVELVRKLFLISTSSS